MKDVFDWIWNGPWWTPLVGALYASVILGIALGPLWGAIKAAKK